MADFKRGDKVVLKSGGPDMAVERFQAFGKEQFYLCSWLDENGTRVANSFKPGMIKLALTNQPEF